MMNYWDSSALIETVYERRLLQRLQQELGVTRTHSLAETFSVLTGNPESRLNPSDTAKVIGNLAMSLTFVELSPAEVLLALKTARKHGVRGGRVHDFSFMPKQQKKHRRPSS